MRQTRRLVLSIVLVGVCVLGSLAAYATGSRPLLGLDLVGGISVVLQGPPGTSEETMQKALETIRNRIDALGVAEPEISLIGGRDIQVEVPGLAQGKIKSKNGNDTAPYCATTSTGEDLGCKFASRPAADAQIQSVGQQRLLDLIGQTARLEERIVTTSSQYVPGKTHLTSCPPSFGAKNGCDDLKVVDCPTSQPDRVGCTTEELSGKPVTYLDPKTNTAFTMGPVLITGDTLAKATAVYQTAGQTNVPTNVGWQIDFQTTKDGARIFKQVTSANLGKQLAIILDRSVESAPTVQGEISSQGQITGSFSEQEAKDLALVLSVGALPVELSKQNVETVSPTLGKTSLHQGLIAGLIGLIVLMLYLAFYYRLLGVVTWLGMTIWALLAFGLLLAARGIGYSLSLAGIAGIIVSLGITADSYIVFYERLKDEVRSGKTMRTAVVPAFRRSWRTIYTADLVTMLAAAVLYLTSIGSVRGFAVTLGFATALDMFVVYFFKRPTVFLISRSERITNLRGFGLRSGVAADPVPAIAGGSE
jgi:preprotein translocase subunit SecD